MTGCPWPSASQEDELGDFFENHILPEFCSVQIQLSTRASDGVPDLIREDERRTYEYVREKRTSTGIVDFLPASIHLAFTARFQQHSRVNLFSGFKKHSISTNDDPCTSR